MVGARVQRLDSGNLYQKGCENSETLGLEEIPLFTQEDILLLTQSSCQRPCLFKNNVTLSRKYVCAFPTY
jgi:hypothetical protein